MESTPHKRRCVRLPDFDYSQAGAYFVTICTNNRECIFGEIIDFSMKKNAIGAVATKSWSGLAESYPFVTLDAWVLMPNHLHGIIWFSDNNKSGKTLSRVIAAFKAISTSQVRKTIDPDLKPWQRGFYEHIIRTENDLFRIREYIEANPAQWALDRENPTFVAAEQGAGAHAMRLYQ